jgi:hypothetical protein
MPLIGPDNYYSYHLLSLHITNFGPPLINYTFPSLLNAL